MAAEALLFDLDGTLGDTHPWYAEALAACCGHSAEVLCRRIRAGEPAILLAERFGVRREFLRICRETGGRLPLYQGVRDVLLALRSLNTTLGLVTSLSPAVTEELLAGSGLRGFFSAIVAAERRMPRKPSPAPVIACIERLGRRPSKDIFYIGDHLNDEASAHRAGISFAWARYGYQDAPPTNPDTVLDRFEDVLRL